MVLYADGPATEVETPIAAPPATVWALITDINLPASFSHEFQGATWIDEGPALGARFEGRNRHERAGEWTAPCVVTGFDINRVFEWTVGDPADKVARWRFDLRPDGDGSHLRFSAEMGPGPSGLTPAISAMPDKEEAIVAGRLAEWRANMERTVDGIRNLAEERTTA